MIDKTIHVTSDYTITTFSNIIQNGLRKIKKVPPAGQKIITFNGDPGLGNFGSSYSTALRINDGTTTVNYTTEDPGLGDDSDSANPTKLAVGGTRTDDNLAAELASKINSSALNISATANANTVTLTPSSGHSVTITEDPANSNSGNFGGSEGYTTISESSTVTEIEASPFRFSTNGVYNIRGQSVSNHYKTFIGEHKS
tara:strand:- start:6155 stop:6751 length:597 start_codon:yes stop_codon:yes gene_type:complete